MNRVSLLLVGCLGATALSVPARCLADTITLKDGSTLEGDLRRSGDGYAVTQANGKVTQVPGDSIARIDVRSPGGGADRAMAALQSLRRASENLSDIKQILARYQSFIEHHAGTPAAEQAASDQQLWLTRQKQGYVKTGAKWVTPAERQTLIGKSTETARMLHGLFKQGRFKEATPLLDRALSIDPRNMSLLYLRGELLFDQGNIPASRKAFEGVLAAAPNHAPTLNNLAVILWRQNTRVAALGMYDRALLAAPESRQILDNIAEALSALPKAERKSPITKKLVDHFKAADAGLQKKMVGQGLYRWGSGWVSEQELAKLQAQEKVINDQINAMQASFTNAQNIIAGIDRRIDDINNEINILDSQSVVSDATGRMYRLPLPPQYYTLSQQLAQAKNDRAKQVDELDRLRKQAAQVKAQLPKPRYSGIQKLIDADGMPIPAGAAAPNEAPAENEAPALPPATAPARPATQPVAAPLR